MNIGDILTKIDLYLLIPIGIMMLVLELLERKKEQNEKHIGNQEIHIIFQHKDTGERKKLRGSLLRKDCTRGEVSGLINMNTASGGRYSIEHMKKDEYFANLKRIQEDNLVRKVELVLSENELKLFPFEDWENV